MPNSSFCLKTTVTVTYNTHPYNNTKLPMNHINAVSVMAGVLQIVRKRLMLCPNVSANLGKVAFDFSSGNSSIQGVFEIYTTSRMSSRKQRNTLGCLHNGSVFENLLRKSTQLMRRGAFVATETKFTPFHNGTCCNHGYILVKTQCGKFNCIIIPSHNSTY